MSERPYTVSEIDALRKALKTRYLFGTTNLDGKSGWGNSFNERDMIIAVEEMTRTFMLAGITAEDIYKEDREK